MLDFNSERHEYRINGRIIPSVTSVLDMMKTWRGASPEDIEHARERGSLVDAAVNRYDAGVLDADAIEDEIVPYVMAWQRFRKDTHCEIVASQLIGHNSTFCYGGTLDKILRMNGSIWLVDLKATAEIEPETALQTAAYAHMGEAMKFMSGNTFVRATLQLKSSGGYRLHEWANRQDFPTFLAALTLKNWKDSR